MWHSLPDSCEKRVSLAKATACATTRHSCSKQTSHWCGQPLLQSFDKNGCCVQDSSQSSMAKEAEGSVGMDLSQLARAASHAQPYPRVDSQGQILSADALKLRGMHAAQYHKTSIEAMLHSTHAGATPYRTVLGDVRLHSCLHLCLVMSVSCLFVHHPSVRLSLRPSVHPSIHPFMSSLSMCCVAPCSCFAVLLCLLSCLKSA